MSYTTEDTADIFWGDHEDFPEYHVHSEITGKHRWGHYEERVYKHRKTGEFWLVSMCIASGDAGEHGPSGAPIRVTPREVAKTVWEAVEKTKKE